MNKSTEKKEVFVRSIWLTSEECGELARAAAMAGWSIPRYIEDMVRAALQANSAKR